MSDAKYGGAEAILALPEAKLVAILRDPSASVYAKAKACQRLAVVGGEAAVEPVAVLLADERLSHYARFALEAIPNAAAGEALRAALSSASGSRLVGVINSIGVRKERRALAALAPLRNHPDAEVAQAAEAAMARLRPPL
jgi:HEAT repeat protein